MQLRQPAPPADAASPPSSPPPPPPVSGEKRKAGRPKGSIKKARLETLPTAPAAKPLTPMTTPVVDNHPPALPSRLSEGRPLPNLARPQARGLSDDDYQSIAASAVLATSLDRSRHAWLQSGLFERYWIKPESGKHARPVPEGNPGLSSMVSIGSCRVRIEPHIFDAAVYTIKGYGPKPPPVPRQQTQWSGQHQQAGQYGQLYRPPTQQTAPYMGVQQQQQQYYGSRKLPAVNHRHQAPPQQQGSYANNTLPPINQQQPAAQSAPLLPPPPAPNRISGSQINGNSDPEKKASPDPVISMLASRASSDPALKALMKEVATGGASPEQLRNFQRHIDELSGIMQRKKAEEEAAERKKQAQEAQRVDEERQRQQQQQARLQLQASTLQYDGGSDPHPSPQAQYQQPSKDAPMYFQPPQQAQHVTYPPTPSPVVLAFTTPNSTEDRFLLPQYAILEFLSPTHCLTSFIITRKGSQVADCAGLEREKEYWQPVTMMIEAFGDEGVKVLQAVQRWVRPAEDVRKHMEETIKRCVRAPESFLALRLPHNNTLPSAETSDVEMTDTGTPKPVGKSGIPAPALKRKYTTAAMKAQAESRTKSSAGGVEENGHKRGSLPSAAGASPDPLTAPEKDGDVANGKPETSATDVEKDGGTVATSESGRPKRATRQNVRFSEL